MNWTDELPALAALTDQQAADAINAMTTIVRARVPRVDIMDYLISNNKLVPIVLDTAHASAATFRFFANSPDYGTIDVDAPAFQSVATVLIADGLATAADAAAISALANRTVPKYPPVGPGMVATARQGVSQ